MTPIVRNRTIRPSSRKATSTRYKIDTEAVSAADTLVVNIDHETKPFKESYLFVGNQVANLNSVHFEVVENGPHIRIVWKGPQPKKRDPIGEQLVQPADEQVEVVPAITHFSSSNTRESMAPIAAADTEILILGSMPGEQSLALGEYYANPGNRFWKIMAAIAGEVLPARYEERTALLLGMKVGLWDVAKSADRKGSMDSEMLNEVPNDLHYFLLKHGSIKTIGFNGTKARDLYDRFFERLPAVRYMTLPSSSGANTSVAFERLVDTWQEIFNE